MEKRNTAGRGMGRGTGRVTGKGRLFKGKLIKRRENEFAAATRKRTCQFCANKVKQIDYKDLKVLERFITERGKVVSRRISKNCAVHQRKLNAAIKRARFIAILPYVKA